MDLKPQLSCLQGKNVTLPGGRDKDGRPLILVAIPPNFTVLDVVPQLQYFASIFSASTRAKGFAVIIDARRSAWKIARSCVKQTNAVFSQDQPAKIIVLKPDVFWDKQRVENCTSYKDNRIVFISRSRLEKFFDFHQLPVELGGCLNYDHEKWIENREKVEEFFKDAEVTLKELDDLHQYLIKNEHARASQVENVITTSTEMAEATKMLVHNVTETGKELVQNIEYENRTRKFSNEDPEQMHTPQDTLDTIETIHELVHTIKHKRQDIENVWNKMEKTFVDTKDLNHLEEAVCKVTNWILGPAEELLNSSGKVGYDVASAEELRREHEAIELQCWKIYGTYAELMHKIDATLKDSKDLISRKDFMDFVCRSFALRLERRRNVLITSLRFFRLVSEYFDKTGEVFDSCIMGCNVGDFNTANSKLKELQDSQVYLDAVEQEVKKQGEKLSDMLSMPVKDALGREISIDYSEDIVNIRDVIDATTARKNIFSDSVELQKITLQQVILVDTYEKDVAEAVKWLEEILRVLLRDHGHVGCTVHEVQKQKDELQNFQETAKDTFNYGCQLLNASLVLRQSCKLPLEPHACLFQKLKNCWQRLNDVNQEQMTRLRVSAVFHRSIEEHCNQLRDMREAVATIPFMDLMKKRSKVKNYFAMREKLMVEVGRMVRLGRLLRSRLREPLCQDETLLLSLCNSATSEDLDKYDSVTNNEIAVEAISERLTEVTQLSEELDQALKSAQQDCIVFSTASTSTFNSGEKEIMEKNHQTPEKPPKLEDVKSDEEFQTASECTGQHSHSRSSSYNTASECEQLYSPWVDYGKDDMKENISKEKMVLAVGLPELPDVNEVLKPSPEVPPGKIVREVTETTHIKVQQQHTFGVKSFVLTSETVREKNSEPTTVQEERMRFIDDKRSDKTIEIQPIDEEDFMRRIKEVGGCEVDSWKSVTKQTVKSFL